MKKNILKLIAAALVLCMLCGCATIDGIKADVDSFMSVFGQFRSYGTNFEDIEYRRPDVELIENTVELLEKALEKGSFFRAKHCINVCYTEYCNFETMYVLANIRSCHNMEDEFYAREYSWCDGNSPKVQQLMDRLYYSCGSSELAPKLEERVFWEGFAQEYSDESQSIYTDEVVALMEEESRLLSRYRSLTAGPTIPLPDGTDVDFGSFISEADSAGFRYALSAYYEKYCPQFAEIYIALVKTRHALAEAAGYDSYEQMQYSFYFDRDYTPQEAAEYIHDIKTIMVPFYKGLSQTGAFALPEYSRVSERKLFNTVRSGAESMGEAVSEAFDFMADHGYYDISVSPAKAPMSFQTYLTDYDAPFLFVNPRGDSGDIITLAHEFGHYLDAYVNYNSYETVDCSETFSQAMELLMLFYCSDQLSSDELHQLFLIKALDTVEMYIQQASFAEFESLVYSADPDTLSLEFLNGLSLKLAREYGYCVPGLEDFYARSWCDIVHFYEMPFYVITYPVSNDAAMQICALEIEKSGSGLSTYLDMLPRDSGSFMDTVSSAGLVSPFEPGRIEAVTEELSYLIEYALDSLSGYKYHAA